MIRPLVREQLIALLRDHGDRALSLSDKALLVDKYTNRLVALFAAEETADRGAEVTRLLVAAGAEPAALEVETIRVGWGADNYVALRAPDFDRLIARLHLRHVKPPDRPDDEANRGAEQQIALVWLRKVLP